MLSNFSLNMLLKAVSNKKARTNASAFNSNFRIIYYLVTLMTALK